MGLCEREIPTPSIVLNPSHFR